MKLSRLVYLCVKNVNYYDDDSFTYDSFITRGIEESNSYSDYSVSIKNVFTPLNEAIQRLSDLERIPYKVVGCLASNVNNNIIDLTNLGNDENGREIKVKEVINVATSDYRRLPFSSYGYNKIRLLRPSASASGSRVIEVNNQGTQQFVRIPFEDNLLIEYKEEIPTFDEQETFPTLNSETDNGDFVFDNNEEIVEEIELSSYGINNAMCQYIIEYVQGKLEEQIDPILAGMHLTRAEQYFSDLKPVSSAFKQEKVYRKYTIN